MAIEEVNKDDIEKKIAKGTNIVLFYSLDCHACEKMKPNYKSTAQAKEKEGIKFFQSDVNKNMKLMFKYDLDSAPSMLIFKDGMEIGRLMGLHTQEEIILAIKNANKEQPKLAMIR